MSKESAKEIVDLNNESNINDDVYLAIINLRI